MNQATERPLVTRRDKTLGISRLSLFQILKASESQYDAFKHDPLLCYIFETPDIHQTSLIGKLFTNYLHRPIYWLLGVLVGGALTVNGGASVIAYYPPVTGRPILRYIKKIASYLHVVRRKLSTPEAKKRHKEFREKLGRAIAESLGDNADKMYYLETIATASAFQGQGLGGALVRTVIGKADAARKATYLISSNSANVPFYKGHGFRSVAAITLGEDNQSWSEMPVKVHLMVRDVS